MEGENKNKPTRLERFHGKSPEEIFNLVYDSRDWTAEESVSGFGSTLEHTKNSRARLPIVFEKYEIKRILDVACGDFNWIQKVAEKVEFYKGNDIVKRLIETNIKKYGVPGKIEFEYGDIIEQPISGEYDAIIVKDVLVHFPDRDIFKALDNFRKSGIKYVFLTHFYEIEKNIDLSCHGQWRPINFTLSPFGLGKPIEIIKEKSEIYSWVDKNNNPVKMMDKSLSLWKIS